MSETQLNFANGLHGVLFFAALDEFDVPSTEVDAKTKLEVSLDVWTDTVQSQVIVGTVPVVLFLNKSDLLAARLNRSPKPFKKAFPDFSGGKDVDAACAHVKKQFLKRLKTGTVTESQVYTHVTYDKLRAGLFPSDSLLI